MVHLVVSFHLVHHQVKKKIMVSNMQRVINVSKTSVIVVQIHPSVKNAARSTAILVATKKEKHVKCRCALRDVTAVLLRARTARNVMNMLVEIVKRIFVIPALDVACSSASVNLDLDAVEIATKLAASNVHIMVLIVRGQIFNTAMTVQC